jgi:hypothetical protein
MFSQYSMLIFILCSQILGLLGPLHAVVVNPDPSVEPTAVPSGQPSGQPSAQPSTRPTVPTGQPSGQPSRQPTGQPSGQPSSHPTAQPSRYCTFCNAGQYYNTALAAGVVNTVLGCVACLPGYTCAGGCNNPVACAPGKYNGNFSALTCTSCAIGSYSQTSGASSCTICPGGYSCATKTAGKYCISFCTFRCICENHAEY